MAAAYRSAASSVASTANASVTEPAGAVSGDVFYGLLVVDTRTSVCTLPTGWSSLNTGQSPSAGSSGFIYNLGRIVRTGSAPSFTCTNPARYREWHVICVSGADTTTPEDASSYLTAATVNPYNPNPPSATAVGSDDLGIAAGVGWQGSASAWTAPAGYTVRSDNTAGNDGILATKALSASGAEDPAAFSGANTGSADGWAGTVLVKSAGGGGGAATQQFLTLLGVGS